MLITDPSKRPSERLVEVVSSTLLPQGYVYKKSKNEYSRITGNRSEMVYLWYNKTANLVRGTLAWAIVFPQLEKIYRQLEIDEIRDSRVSTLWTDLLNFPPIRNSSYPSDIELYDKKTLKYDDFSINNAASELLGSYKKFVLPFFDHYRDLSTLEAELNKFPLAHHPYIGYGGRHITFGLVLGKLFNPESHNSLAEAYSNYITTGTEDDEFKQKMESYRVNVLKYLNTTNLDAIFPADNAD